MDTSIFDVSHIWSNVEKTIEFLQQHRLIKENHVCCGMNCNLVKCHTKDGKEFKCYTCGKRYSLRTGSFFSRSKLSLCVLLTVVYFFSNNLSIVQTMKMLKRKISKPSLIQWFVYLREICSLYLLNNPQILGGQDRIVEIDESALGRKRKYNRGAVRGIGTTWVFGILDIVTKQCHVQLVPNRSRATLLPIITRHIAPHSTIHSDQANVYRTLRQINGYTHKTVCHKDNYVNPTDGTHTNNIECFWAHLKNHIKHLHGVDLTNLPIHLDEYCYRWNRKLQGDFSIVTARYCTFLSCLIK